MGKNKYPLLPFRPNEEDKKRIAFIRKAMSLSNDTAVIRIALEYAESKVKRQLERKRE
jgi:hypothetical protein